MQITFIMKFKIEWIWFHLEKKCVLHEEKYILQLCLISWSYKLYSWRVPVSFLFLKRSLPSFIDKISYIFIMDLMRQGNFNLVYSRILPKMKRKSIDFCLIKTIIKMELIIITMSLLERETYSSPSRILLTTSGN